MRSGTSANLVNLGGTSVGPWWNNKLDGVELAGERLKMIAEE